MSFRLNKKRAFTLIELLILLIIVSVFYSYSFSQLNNLYYKLNQRFYLSKIKNIIELSQAKAFHEKNVKIFLNENELRMFFNNVLKKILIIPKKFTISFPNIVNKTINFYPTGVQTPFTIELNSKFYKCILTTSLRGRIRSECGKA